MILQPLVENAIVHGVSRCRPCGRLKIEISSLEHRLLIRIYNDVAPCSGAPETNGIGLRNTRERLEILYPESHSMEIVEDKRGVTVLLELPLQFASERCS